MGYAALAAFLVSVFTSIFAFITKYLTIKVAFVLAVAGAFAVLLIAFNSAFNLLMASIAVSIPAEFSWGLAFIPTNAPVCMAAIATARVARMVFEVKLQIAKTQLLISAS